MYSIWWIFAAFVAGGYAGVLLLSLMTMAAREGGVVEGGEHADTWQADT